MWPDAGLVDVPAVSSAWTRLAAEFCDTATYWNVFAADIKNEPFNMYWGPRPEGAPLDLYPPDNRWDEVAGALGSFIHAACPRWLLFVEGVGHCQQEKVGYEPQGDPHSCEWPSSAGQDLTFNTWWGEGLQAAAAFPVQIRREDGTFINDKVVYSPHTYGPGVYAQHYFKDPTFPENMHTVWDHQYGHMSHTHEVPIVIGEWGGINTGDDAKWMSAFADYLKSRDFGFFFW